MHRAVAQLKITPELLLIDGNRFKQYEKIPHECIIKGDGKYLSIAAASILAKTHRDDYMKKIDAEFPMYGWKHLRLVVFHSIAPVYLQLQYWKTHWHIPFPELFLASPILKILFLDRKASIASPSPKPLSIIFWVFLIFKESEMFKKLKTIGLLTPVSSKKDKETPLISTGMIIKLLMSLNFILSTPFLLFTIN